MSKGLHRNLAAPLIGFLALCTPVGCNRASAPSEPSTNARGSIVGSWYSKDYLGLTCEFKTDRTYHAEMGRGSNLIFFADGTYSVNGTKFAGGEPKISTN